MGCPIKECKLPHKNMSEHYADNVSVAKTPAVAKTLLKAQRPKESVAKTLLKVKPTKLPVAKTLLKAKGVNERSKAWRDKNRVAYNDRQRELMREKKRGDKYDSEEEGT